jgi:BirA family biotin operon repressor/biotin-[acetyl-CoA-carboxylase] ligase
MPATVPALSSQVLARALQGADLDWELVARIASTQAELAERARRGAPSRAMLLAAQEQTAGRGRHGRTWLSAPGASLVFSLALPWRRAAAASTAVTLACGVALARCLAAQGIVVQVKWPNDILLRGRKLAGILTELIEHEGARTLVIGVGLNLRVDPAQQAAIGQPAAGLADAPAGAGVAAPGEAWLARLALALLEAAREFERRGFAGLRKEFNRHCAFVGQPVTLLDGIVAPAAAPRAGRHGVLRGVDDDGRLLLESDGRVLAMMSGDVSLRADDPP